MGYPEKRQIKKLIYIEMIMLSLLLVVAVMIVSRLNNAARSDNAPSDSRTASNGDVTEATEPAPTWKTFPEDRALTAKQYFVYDCRANTFLANSGQESQRVSPASITIFFTAYTIIETNILNPTDIFTIGEDVLALVPAGSTVAHLQAGDRLTGRQLMEGMLLGGGNDAAFVLACESGRKFASQPNMEASAAIQVFVQEMNQLNREKGMVHTNLTTPIATQDPNHYTTFQDLVILGNLCMQYNTIMDPAIKAEADIKLHGETIIWKNANELINSQSEYYCPYAVGLNAGQAQEGDNCLLAAFKKDSQYLLIGVFGCPEAGDSFDDVLQLFNQTIFK